MKATMDKGVAGAELSYGSVQGACVALREHQITEDEFVTALVALPVVKQAKLPTDKWFDAIVVKHGPVFQLRREVYRGNVSARTYAVALEAMLDAGHAA